MPPKITVESQKKSTEVSRNKRGNKEDVDKLSANPSDSKNDQQKKISDNASVVGQNSDKAVVPSQHVKVSNPKRTLHRKQVKSSWIREITKTNREHGKAYKGYEMTAKGVVHGVDRPERILGPRCSSNFCLTSKMRNCHNIDKGKRVDMFEAFWDDLG